MQFVGTVLGVSGPTLGLCGPFVPNCTGRLRHQEISPEIEPSDRLAAGILHPEGLGVLDDSPRWREAAGGHCPNRAK
jgi:hypothetical protein